MRCHVGTCMKLLIAAFFLVCYTLIILWQVDVPLNQVSGSQNVGASGSLRTAREIKEKPPISSQNEQLKNLKTNQRKVAAFKENVSNSQTSLDDLFISIKTTKSFHHSRLSVILRTWFILARDQVCNFEILILF